MKTLSILNVFEGDVVIIFDKNNPAETIRASRIIKDMLRRGYALLVEVDGAYQRALDFDEKISSYIIADYDPTAIIAPQEKEEDGQEAEENKTPAAEAPKKRRGRRRAVAIDEANAVGIARSAGG